MYRHEPFLMEQETMSSDQCWDNREKAGGETASKTAHCLACVQ